MKKINVVVLSFFVGVLVGGCSKKESDDVVKMRVENNIVNECMSMAKKIPNLSASQITSFRDYCNCTANKVIKGKSGSELANLENIPAASLNEMKQMANDAAKACASELGIQLPN